MEIMKATKITRKKESMNLSGLVYGDNLRIEKGIEVIISASVHSGLYEFKTVTENQGFPMLNTYVANTKMLEEGELYDTESFNRTPTNEQIELYEKLLISVMREVTA